MTYAWVQDVPIDEQVYKQILARLGPEPLEGLIAHLALRNDDGTLRYIDVWESEAHWDRFAEERLHPVVHLLLGEIFGATLPPEPVRTPLAVIHTWQGKGDT